MPLAERRIHDALLSAEHTARERPRTRMRRITPFDILTAASVQWVAVGIAQP